MRILAIEAFRVGELRVPHRLEGPLFPLLGGVEPVDGEGFLHLGPDAHGGVHGGHGLLEDHGDGLAPEGPELFSGGGEDVHAVEGDLAGDLRPGVGQQGGQGHGGDRLAAARLPHQAQDLPRLHVEGDALHGVLAGGLGPEVDPEVFDVKHGVPPSVRRAAAAGCPRR